METFWESGRLQFLARKVIGSYLELLVLHNHYYEDDSGAACFFLDLYLSKVVNGIRHWSFGVGNDREYPNDCGCFVVAHSLGVRVELLVVPTCRRLRAFSTASRRFRVWVIGDTASPEELDFLMFRLGWWWYPLVCWCLVGFIC